MCYSFLLKSVTDAEFKHFFPKFKQSFLSATPYSAEAIFQPVLFNDFNLVASFPSFRTLNEYEFHRFQHSMPNMSIKSIRQSRLTYKPSSVEKTFIEQASDFGNSIFTAFSEHGLRNCTIQ